MSKRSKNSKKAKVPEQDVLLTQEPVEIVEQVEGDETPEATAELTVGQIMAKQLRDARPRYRATTTANGNKSLCNGDEVAVLLEGLSPEDVMKVVEGKLKLGAGTLAEKYGKLNPGQKRMNAGNLLRNAAKRGEVEL